MTEKLTTEEVKLLIAGLSGNRTLREEKYLAALEIALTVLEQHSGWISCSERMPEEHQSVDYVSENVLVLSRGDEVEISCTDRGIWVGVSDVTHWMPLPAPPALQPSTDPHTENDGWIEWGGGEQPVPSSTPVEIKFRCGETSRNNSAGVWRWDWEPDDPGHYEIVAYRVIENDGREG